jgi:8-oxo-dGTP diphosphatase
VYVARPGAYAVAADASGKLALLRTPRGYFLPGGGIDGNETAEAALSREVREELGREADILRKIGLAIQYVYAEDEARYFRKVGHFYVATLGSLIATPSISDHHLVWCAPAEALSLLTQPFQGWAVREAYSI